jgi:hypothetical protein
LRSIIGTAGSRGASGVERSVPHRRIVPILICVAGFVCASASGQPPPVQKSGNSEAPYVLRVTAREVVLDLIAADARNRPVRDLNPAELTVQDQPEHSRPITQTISSLHILDREPIPAAAGEQVSGFRLGGMETCLDRASVHYELAYNPGATGQIAGFHDVKIHANRRGVRLFYRHRYFVGQTAGPTKPDSASPEPRQLREDACSHLTVPASIGLRAAQIESGDADAVHFSVDIDSESLAFVSFSDDGRRLQLDYGACNFNAAGLPIDYLSGYTDQVLTPVEFARAQEHGLYRVFKVPRHEGSAMIRLVVRDRATGNLGLADVVVYNEGLPEPDSALRSYLKQSMSPRGFGNYQIPLGPIGSFGSVVPATNSFCGDVFELEPNTPWLPDFRTMDPIGSIYTPFLGVPEQYFLGTQGIPGVTDRTTWFAVDYHATFWVSRRGRYEFQLLSDDGAMLVIDDERVIDLDGLHSAMNQTGSIVLETGRHSIHVPYYEGLPYAVALELWVRPPDGQWRLFDLRDFAEPQAPAPQAQ